MRVNLKNYSYSQSNAVGSALKRPLFKVVSNIVVSSYPRPYQNQALRITKLVLHYLVAIAAIIPLGTVYLLGKSITHFGKTKINNRNLSLAPRPIEVPVDAEPNQAVNFHLLSQKFRQRNPRDNRINSLIHLCNLAALGLRPHSDLFSRQLSIYLKGIIRKMESGEISADKENDILKELAEASTRCRPTWLEVAARLYAEVHGQAETVDVKLLRLIQEFKEAIILDYSQNEMGSQWHALNIARNLFGRELGLNTNLSSNDPYGQGDATSAFAKGIFKWLVVRKYEKVNRIIDSIKESINSKQYDQSYYEFILEKVRQRNIEGDPNEFVQEHFFDEDYKLNVAGVNFMLKSIGIFK